MHECVQQNTAGNKFTASWQSCRRRAAPRRSVDRFGLPATQLDAALFSACRRREGEGLPFSEEVLVGRGDIDERRERMAELEAQARDG